jgi:DNA polymerase III epsilon subunit-like protein
MTTLLFLDTETNALTPSKGQIIEIGGAIIDIDPTTFQPKLISKFESLVRLESTYEDKIQRLTGITKQELTEATIIKHVQEQWLNFIEPYEDKIEGIIGHSVYFDLAFLKAEKWFLPSKKIIDTLDLSKIVFSDMEAINLEFLSHRLNLEKDYKELLETSNSTAHRALYDTLVDVALFCSILTRISVLNLPRWLSESIVTQFLNDDLFSFYPDTTPLQKISTKQPIPSEINWFGVEKNLIGSKIISSLNESEATQVLSKLESIINQHSQLKGNYLIVLLTLATSVFISAKFNSRLHYSFFGDEVFLYYKLVSSYIFSEVHTEFAKQIDSFETLILANPTLSQKSLSFKQLLSLLTVLADLSEKDSPLQPLIHDINNQVDFLSFYIAKLDASGVFAYSFYKKNSSTEQVFSKIRGIIASTNELIEKTPDGSSIISDIKKKIVELVAFELRESLDYEFVSRGGETVVNYENHDFDINQYLTDLLAKNEISSVETFLHAEEVKKVRELFGIAEEVVPLTSVETSKTVEFAHYYELSDIISSAPEKTLILFSQNKTFKELIDRLLPTLNSEQYLIYGETGSLTKIKSKVIKGFAGVTVLRLNDYRYFLRDKAIEHFEQVYIVDLPYVQVSKSILKKNSGQEMQVISTLRKLLLTGHVNTLLSVNETLQVTTFTKTF